MQRALREQLRNVWIPNGASLSVKNSSSESREPGSLPRTDMTLRYRCADDDIAVPIMQAAKAEGAQRSSRGCELSR